jgi:hypothetical protein
MQPEKSSTPPSKPVMDVKVPVKTPPMAAPSLPVQQAPAEQDDTAISDKLGAAASVESAPAQKVPAPKPATPQGEHHAPVGIIMVTVCFMLGLAGIAIAIYLKSR